MAKCTHCGSRNTVCINKGERIGAFILGGIVGAFGAMFNPSAGAAAGSRITRENCPYKKYICVECKKEFSISNS